MDTRWFFRLARKDEAETLTPAERKDFNRLLALYEADWERRADDERKGQIAGMLGDD